MPTQSIDAAIKKYANNHPDRISYTPLNILGADRGIKIGAASHWSNHSNPYAQANIIRNVDMITPENTAKMGRIDAAADKYTGMPGVDMFVQDVRWAHANGLGHRLHALYFYSNITAEVLEAPESERLGIILAHFDFVRWVYDAHDLPEPVEVDFINEIIWHTRPAPVGVFGLRDDPILNSTYPDNIAILLIKARELFPNSLMIWNDIPQARNSSWAKDWLNHSYDLLDHLKAEGVRLDGIGMQSHLKNSQSMDLDNYSQWLGAVGSLGYLAPITELDIQDDAGTGDIAGMAAMVEEYLTTCLKHPHVNSLTLWHLNNPSPSWYRTHQHPYDADLEPTIFRDAVARALINS